MIREIELLTEARVTLLADRRKIAPYGLHGGGNGRAGQTRWIAADGRRRKMASKFSISAERGDRIVIETPGGGGFGLE